MTERRLIDCFIFYNEIDLLTYRLNILHELVDYFIIVESTHTFIGNAKPLIFNENKHLFEKFEKKIIHIIVNDFPYKKPHINISRGEQWLNEYFQRNAITRGIQFVPDLRENDLIIIADVDEIPDPYTLYKIKSGNIAVNVNGLLMDFYYYNLNTKMSMSWDLGKILTYGIYQKLNMTCNDIRKMPVQHIQQGGWHLSYFGDAGFIKNKIREFSHQELNNDNFTDLSKIKERVNSGKDLFDRADAGLQTVSISDNRYLPIKYDVYLTKYYS